MCKAPPNLKEKMFLDSGDARINWKLKQAMQKTCSHIQDDITL